MTIDAQGNTLTGASSETAEMFDQATRAFNIYTGDPLSFLDRATEIAPDFAMAHILKAHILALATEPAATLAAKDILTNLKAMRLSDREASHVAALDRVVEGDWSDAAVALDWHSMLYPHDLVALQSGHLMDFYRANARGLRDRIARALPKWAPNMPGYPILLGMYAFGLEETADYSRAEATGRRALDMEPLDCWAHHAVTHVMEMQGRSEEGITWMVAREPFWSGEDNFFKVHNWWHRALFHLDLDQRDEALALYDREIRSNDSTVALEMIDASALLWRLHLCGHDVGNRWHELAAAWDLHSDGRTYPFNDLHGVMAYLGSGREAEVDHIIGALREAAASETATWGREFAVPLIEGFAAFWREDYALAVQRLYGARSIANAFGGSHAQRDVIDWTLTEAAVRGELPSVAEALANERLAIKPGSLVNKGLFRRAVASLAPERHAA